MSTGTTPATPTVDKDAEKAAAKALKDAAKLKAKAERDAKKLEKQAAATQAKEDKKTAKLANKLPTQNDVTRPKANTSCGKAWSVFDKLSADSGAPALIGDAMKALATIPEATVRTQFARWRKFNGVVGRAPKPAAVVAAAPAPAAE